MTRVGRTALGWLAAGYLLALATAGPLYLVALLAPSHPMTVLAIAWGPVSAALLGPGAGRRMLGTLLLRGWEPRTRTAGVVRWSGRRPGDGVAIRSRGEGHLLADDGLALRRLGDGSAAVLPLAGAVAAWLAAWVALTQLFAAPLLPGSMPSSQRVRLLPLAPLMVVTAPMAGFAWLATALAALLARPRVIRDFVRVTYGDAGGSGLVRLPGQFAAAYESAAHPAMAGASVLLIASWWLTAHLETLWPGTPAPIRLESWLAAMLLPALLLPVVLLALPREVLPLRALDDRLRRLAG
ncbi:MAG: hypothetical protein LWW86_16345 [Micrococcales bacterium]|nr:hypothetical protein [Micrococcales bacterium]